MFSFSCTPTATRSNAHPWQCKRLIALFFPLFFLVACAESSMAKYVLCSAMTGTIVMNGAPVADARVVRRYDWHWGNQRASDETVTDKQGRFSLPEITGKSMSAWLPHQPNIDQDIEVYVGAQKYEIWAGNKFSYEPGSELKGKPKPLRFDVLGKAVTHEHIVGRFSMEP
ncbi:MAG TPA: hypothetical protein PK586_04640 [Casimicrobium sp.]|nr:hypothetical protein [Casimicrobium sp.]